ncbi:MAG: type IV pilus secretin PilQ [Polyangiaceae bacterium]
MNIPTRTLAAPGLGEEGFASTERASAPARPRIVSLLRWTLVLVLLLLPTGHSWAGQPTVSLRDVKMSARPDGAVEVAVTTSAAPHVSARVAEGGKRLIVDVLDAVVSGAPPALTDGNALVAGVMTQGFQTGDQRTARVLVQLAKPAAYRLRTGAEGFVIELVAADKTGPAASRPEVGKPAAPAAPAARGAAQLQDVRFDHRGGIDRVVLALSAVPQYQEAAGAERSTVELRGVAMPEALQRKLDTGAFGGPVRGVSTWRKPSDPTRVMVEVEHAAGAKGSLSVEGTSLVYSFGMGEMHSSVTGKGADGGVARRSRSVAREEAVTDTMKVETTVRAQSDEAHEATTEPDRADAFLPTMAGQQRRFTGRRIDLDLKDADIHNVLRLISDVGRVNIVTADTVSGTVTIRMRDVPWDAALETVLQAKGLGMVRQGNMIRVAQLADLNKERELAIARRKSDLQLAPMETRLIPVNYASAADMQDRSKDMLSPRGTIAVDDRTNVLIVRDVAGNLNQIEELVRSLDTQTPQVLIEARVVEATSRYLRDVGIQWGGDATFSAATGNPTGLAFPSSVGIAGGASDDQTPTAGLSPFASEVANPNFAVNLPAATGTGLGGAIGLTFGSINNTVNLAVRLSAAEASGMLRIVSSPRILTLDNREARISQGTLIPFSQISAQGVQTTFQEAKLQLLVKPHVTADGSVAMHVKINRDEPDFNQTSARGDPTILKREAETDLLIMDGHTAVIGGIFTRNTGRNLDQIPLLGDIPVLGILFQRRRASDTRSELVIFLTPRIVNRAEALGQ